MYFRWLICIFAVAFFSFGCTQIPKKESTQISWLATLNAPFGQIVEKKRGEFQLVLTYSKDSENMVTLFSDRPHRMIKKMPLHDFYQFWNGNSDFNQVPPNASLIYETKTSLRKEHIVILSNPSYNSTKDGITILFDIKIVSGSATISSGDIKEIWLFIDNFWDDIVEAFDDFADGVVDVADDIASEAKKVADEIVTLYNDAVNAVKAAVYDVVDACKKIEKLIVAAAPGIARSFLGDVEDVADDIKDLADEFKCWGLIIGDGLLSVVVSVVDAVATDGMEDISWRIFVSSMAVGSVEGLKTFVERILSEFGAGDSLADCVSQLSTPLIQMMEESLDMNAFVLDMLQQYEAYKINCPSIFNAC